MDTPQKSITQIETPISKSRFEVSFSIINILFIVFLVNVLVLLVSAVYVLYMVPILNVWFESLKFSAISCFKNPDFIG